MQPMMILVDPAFTQTCDLYICFKCVEIKHHDTVEGESIALFEKAPVAGLLTDIPLPNKRFMFPAACVHQDP